MELGICCVDYMNLVGANRVGVVQEVEYAAVTPYRREERGTKKKI